MLYFSKIRIFLISFFTLLFVFVFLSNFIKSENFLFKKKINLGLDLQGGSYLLLEIDNTPVITQKLQNSIPTFKKFFRDKDIILKNFKVLDDNFLIFEADKKDINEIKNFLENKKENLINEYYPKFKSHKFNFLILENIFKLNFSKHGLIKIKVSSQNQALETIRRRVDEIGTNEPNIIKRGNDRIVVELPGLDNPSRIKNLLGKTANLTFRFITKKSEETFGSEKLLFEDGSEEAIVSKRIIISGENLLYAQPYMDTQTNETVVTFSLDRVGAKRFGKATSTGIGKRLAIVLDGKVISAPVIRDAIVSGSGQISGDFTFQTATDLALLLRSGALPAPLYIIEERSVGPDLGQDSINAGVIALAIGFLMVILFMFYKYRIFGFIANITLILNLFLLVGILTLFEATLTLPGIAGIILTVGMAVDANVLIFERIREETIDEKNQLIAFDSGYEKSKSAVLDANITTLISAIILFFMGSGPIKGFSVTLGVGIFTTLFSVYFIARMLTSIYVIKNKNKGKLI